MENIYKGNKNDLLSISEKFIEFIEELNVSDLDKFPENEAEIKEAMKFTGTDEEFEKLENSILLGKHLAQNDDVRILVFEPGQNENRRKSVVEISKKALRLNTFREIMKSKEKKRAIFPKSVYSFRHLYKQPASIDVKDLYPYEDVLISIRVYRPFCRIPEKRDHGPQFSEEFLVLGSQYLTELRDKISCITDNGPVFDISEDPHQSQPKHTTNSGFFFITDTFYNDMRDPKNLDYSEVIREWAKNKKEFPSDGFKIAKMEDTKFMDLIVRLGFPQVYQHNGNCEHLFVFSSIEILSSNHNLVRDDYPILNTMAIPSRILCNICGSRDYSYVVKNSQRQLHDPTYLCSICFESFHYVDGRKVGDFEAYKLNPNEIDTMSTNDCEADEYYIVEIMNE